MGAGASSTAEGGGEMAMGGATGAALAVGVPQDLQNFALGELIALHWLQTIPGGISCAGAGATAARRSHPQDLQNLAVSVFAVAHFGQLVAINFLAARVG
jgi:hypothetical protein